MMLFLSRLRLKNWRNFKDVDLRLQERMFVVGPNASGKSNLLDAIRFLRDLAKEGGGLITAVEERGGIKKIRCLAAKQDTDIEIMAEVGERPSCNGEITHKWTYHLVFNQEGGGIRTLRPIIRRECISPATGKDDVIKKGSHTRLEQPSMLRDELIELREFFSSITYQHMVPQLLRYPHLFRDAGKGEDHFGLAFIEKVSKANKRTRDSRLKRIQEVIKKFVPGMDELKLARDDKGIPHLQIRYRHWRPHSAFQYEDQFSDGTLRLLGFMWSILDGTHPLLLEEPEISLHPFLVRELAEAISQFQRSKHNGRRQVIVSTHSPDLLQNRGIALEEIVLLSVDGENTRAVVAASVQEAVDSLEIGGTPAEIVEQQSGMQQEFFE